MDPGQCRSCGAEIIWADTVGGAHVPLDPKAEKRFVQTEEGGQVVLVDTWVTHFATCPNAKAHRKSES